MSGSDVHPSFLKLVSCFSGLCTYPSCDAETFPKVNQYKLYKIFCQHLVQILRCNEIQCNTAVSILHLFANLMRAKLLFWWISDWLGWPVLIPPIPHLSLPCLMMAPSSSSLSSASSSSSLSSSSRQKALRHQRSPHLLRTPQAPLWLLLLRLLRLLEVRAESWLSILFHVLRIILNQSMRSKPQNSRSCERWWVCCNDYMILYVWPWCCAWLLMADLCSVGTWPFKVPRQWHSPIPQRAPEAQHLARASHKAQPARQRQCLGTNWS